MANSASFPFTKKPQFPFLWKTPPPPFFAPTSMGLYGPWITWYSGGNWLWGGMSGGVYIPIHWGEAFSATFTHRGGNQLANKSTVGWQGGPDAINLRIGWVRVPSLTTQLRSSAGHSTGLGKRSWSHKSLPRANGDKIRNCKSVSHLRLAPWALGNAILTFLEGPSRTKANTHCRSICGLWLWSEGRLWFGLPGVCSLLFGVSVFVMWELVLTDILRASPSFFPWAFSRLHICRNCLPFELSNILWDCIQINL